MIPGEDELGGFVGRYVTDAGRHGKVAIVTLPIGVAALAAAVPVVVQTFEEAGSGTFAGLLLGVALVCLWSGITNGWRYAQRHGETYVLREGGLVHRGTGSSRVIPWTDIRQVSDIGQPGALGAAMGWDVHCRIRLRTGGRLLLTGFTAGAPELARTLQLAVHEGVRPLPRERP